MALRDMLLHLDGGRGGESRTDVAVSLAREHEAHLTALCCIPELQLPSLAMASGRTLEEESRWQSECADRLLERFVHKARQAGVPHETRKAHPGPAGMAHEVAINARYADLAMLGQIDPSEPPAPDARPVIEHTVLAAGRPVLVLPHPGASAAGAAAPGGRVVVAWDAGREATRAVNDALPILERADRVDVVAVNPIRNGERHGQEPGADIALHLARHGIEVDVQLLDAGDQRIAEALLSRVTGGPRGDMLVMGAYVHGRLGAALSGSVTRAVLERTTVPVLLSH